MTETKSALDEIRDDAQASKERSDARRIRDAVEAGGCEQCERYKIQIEDLENSCGYFRRSKERYKKRLHRAERLIGKLVLDDLIGGKTLWLSGDRKPVDKQD
jgi:hypothetical protein